MHVIIITVVLDLGVQIVSPPASIGTITMDLHIIYMIYNVHVCCNYRIAGNFHMVQIFAVFADRLGATKIRTAKS